LFDLNRLLNSVTSKNMRRHTPALVVGAGMVGIRNGVGVVA